MFYACVAALAQGALATLVTFPVPPNPPAGASPVLSRAPVGLSFEFFTYPAYMSDVAATSVCLANLKEASGTWPPVRIGGTTQDRATYDPSLSIPVNYTVASPQDAPASLTFGPGLVSLAAEYGGSVVLGLNRRLNDLPNTVSAAALARKSMPNLDAIELGNEPNFYSRNDPIANAQPWIAAADYNSQTRWQKAVCTNLSADSLISAGVYFGTAPMSITGLSAAEGGANRLLKHYCSHNYPQSGSNANLSNLMSHSAIVAQIRPFSAEISAANAKGKSHIFGETNSATQGGGGISPTFGAALWVMDYVMQSLLLGTQALYFHQGTIGNCQYCWWGRYDIGAPYYGAYFATLALAGADRIASLDSQTGDYAAYAIYKDGRPIRILLYNSVYYASGSRPAQAFTLTGLSHSQITAKRLTAPSATSRQDQGSNPSIAGQTFANSTCEMQGTPSIETATVSGSQVTVMLAASEALLIYL